MLTYRQKTIYDFIVQYQAQYTIAPSIEEIRIFLGVQSAATVHKHLMALERRGAIRRSPGLARGIELVRQPSGSDDKTVVEVPVVATLADISLHYDASRHPHLPVGRWQLPGAAVGELILYQIPRSEADGIWQKWVVIDRKDPIPEETLVLGAFILDSTTSMVRWVQRGREVRIFRDNSPVPFLVRENRIVWIGKVVAQLEIRAQNPLPEAV